MQRTAGQLLATAYHEAGHAVAAHYLGIPITGSGVTIVAGDSFDGCVSTLPEFLFALGHLTTKTSLMKSG